MKWLKSEQIKFIYYLYISMIIVLMLIKTDGKIKLAATIWGFRGDHFVHSTIFIPYMILISLIFKEESFKTIVIKKLPIAFLFAAFCESLHLFLPYRTFSIFDFFANCIGLSLGLGLSILVRKILR